MACPTCNDLASSSGLMGQPFASDPNRRFCRDPTCPQFTFCSVHGNLHPYQFCSDYLCSPAASSKKQLDLTPTTDETIQRTTKPCSRCGVRIEKSAGCDLIICTNCYEYFCYKCGTHKNLVQLKGKKSSAPVLHCRQCANIYTDHGFYRHAPRWGSSSTSRQRQWWRRQKEQGCVVS